MLSSSVHLAAAAPLHSTRLLRALTPVAVAHSESFGSFRTGARVTISSRHRGADSAATLPGSVARTYVPDPNLTSATTSSGAVSAGSPALVEAALRVHRQPLPPPEFPLDQLPYYEPNDLNGPPRVRFCSMQPMRTLPAPLALHFYFPDLDPHTSGAGVGYPSGGGGVDDDVDGDAGDGGYGGGRSGGGSRPPWSSGARYGADVAWGGGPAASGYGGGAGGGGGGGAAAPGAVGEAAALTCRLCGGSIDVLRGPRQHLQAVERSNNTCHHLREVALDTLTLLLIRGYPVDDIATVWADILYRHPAFPRIHELSSPRWSIEKRAERLGDILHGLRHAGIIDLSFSASEPPDMPSTLVGLGRGRSVAFQSLEYFGDTCWGANSALRVMLLFPDQQWLYSERQATFACMRDACEMNLNLDFVFDTLKLSRLLPRASLARLASGKVKADIVEALLGELHVHLYRMIPMLQDDVEYVETNGAREAQLVGLIQHCLTEIYDLIVLNLARALVSTAIPLAKELAAKRVWQQIRPLLLPYKRPAVRGLDASRARLGVAAVGSQAGTAAAVPSMTAFPSAVPGVTGATPLVSMQRTPSSSLSQVSQVRTPRSNLQTAANAAAALLEDFFDVAPSPVQQQHHQHGNVDGEVADPSPSLSAPGGRSASEAAPLDADTGAEATSTNPASAAAQSTLESLTLSAAIALRNARVLPAVPRLFPTPRALPAMVPHPLRRLALGEIPQQTYCEHTGGDVFAGVRRSYDRLGLLRVTEERPRCVVSRAAPDWAPLIGVLVPQLVRFSDAVAVDYSLEAAADAAAVKPADGAQTEAVRRLFASMEERELYWRDPLYDLATAPAHAADAAAGADRAGAFVPTPAWALANSGLPPLAAAAAKESDADGDGSGRGQAGSTFATSLYVAPGTRTPPAGVVTDRNLSRGSFAFLAVGVPFPVERAERLASGLEKSADRDGTGDKSAEQSSGEGSTASAAGAPVEGNGEYSEARVKAAFDYWRRRRRQVNTTSAPPACRTPEAVVVPRVFAVGAG